LKTEPEQAETLNNMGVICLKEDNDQLAIDYFTQALAVDDNNLDARNNIAATFIHHERYENAIAHYQEYLKLRPNDVEANYNIAVAYMSLGFLKDAITHYERAIQEQEDHTDAHANLGAVYLRLEQRNKAIEHFEKALELEPENTAVQFMLSAMLGNADIHETPADYIKNLFDPYALHYDKHLLERLHYQIPGHLQQAVTSVSGVTNAKWKILDIGCGTGLSGEVFVDYAERLVGIDLSEKMLNHAKQKEIYDHLVNADIMDYLSECTTRFDLIIAADVFGYIGELKPLFKLCRKALDEKGLFAFSVEQTDKEPYELQKTARFAYSKPYIETIAEQTGFKVEVCNDVIARIQEGKVLRANVFVLRTS